jgi:hypothetical protein
MPTRPTVATIGIGVLLVSTLRCGGDESGPSELSECAGPVTLSVSAGTEPRFTWTPACRLFLVLVEDPSGDGDQWGVLSDSSNNIAPGVSYGVIPSGATKELLAPVHLVAGRSYHATVARFTGPGHEDGTIIGQRDFTP